MCVPSAAAASSVSVTCFDTNRLHPPVMTYCASVDREDTILAVQTHAVKANRPWHQADLPLMNHAAEVNSIWTGALVGHSVSLKKKLELAENGAQIPESEFMNT